LNDGSNREAPITKGAPRTNIDADRLIAMSAAPKPLAHLEPEDTPDNNENMIEPMTKTSRNRSVIE
jgi:hypothetical protein